MMHINTAFIFIFKIIQKTIKITNFTNPMPMLCLYCVDETDDIMIASSKHRDSTVEEERNALSLLPSYQLLS